MANVTIRGLPDEVHALLKERARRNRRSLNQEIIAELSSLGDGAESEEERIEQARVRMRRARGKIDEMRSKLSRFLSTKEVDEALGEGRR